jgi:uncharacterized membrane protein YfcA
MWIQIFFVLLGLIFGTFGTLVGAGGGFILMPVLLLMFPNENPEILTSISLAVVFFNASSGSVAYSRMKKIDYKSGFIFAAAAVPGAVLGAYSVKYIDREIFNIIFGILLTAASVYLFFKPQKSGAAALRGNGKSFRRIVDIENNWHEYSFSGKTGIAISAAVGFLSSMLGIGGGIIHVPVMVNILNFPVHIATATSHFILALIALAGTIVHLFTGSFTKESIIETLFLSAGVIAGAQLGARLSRKIQGRVIIKVLAVALCFVGIRIIIMSL